MDHHIEANGETTESLLTGFIGRENDLYKLEQMLAEPSCRLVSLVGPGGIGKTRLGMEVVRRAQDRFADGSYFIPLQGITSVEQIIPAIASGVSCELSGDDDTLVQLIYFLEHKNILILLDNFEHLMDAVDVIVRLLDASKRLKLVVTSREVLNLRAEWVWSVIGLQFPDQNHVEIAKADSAVHLFDRCARRVLPEFSVELEKIHVIRICKLVGGVPLAIELAASWLKSLTCEMIAEEIQHNLDFLATNMRDMPERHRSMRAIIDRSWQMLTGQEQDIFKQLSIFRGGFTSEAGDQIVGASRVILSSLVDKSLVSYNAGRYNLHELLRQHAQQLVETDANRSEQLRDAHANYYVQFLADRLHTYRSQPSVLGEMLVEIDNIYLMWESIVAGKQFPRLDQALHCFGALIQYRINRQAGIKMLTPAIETYQTQANFPETLPAYTALLTTQSWYHASLMQYSEALTLAEECQTLIETYDFRPIAHAGSDPLIHIGMIRLFQGDYHNAIEYGLRAVEQGTRYNDLPNMGHANQLVGMVYLAMGDLEKARYYGQLALSQSKQGGNLAICAYCTDHLGDIAFNEHDPVMAEHYFTEGYRYRVEINDRANLPSSMMLLGKAKFAQGQYVEAMEWFKQCISHYSADNNSAYVVVPKSQLALCYAHIDEYEHAHTLFLEAINGAELIQVVPVWLALMTHIGEFLIQLGELENGTKLLSIVINHPMFNQGRNILIDVQLRLNDLKNLMSEEQFIMAQQAGIYADFDAITHALEHDVSRAIVNIVSHQPSPMPENQQELYAKGIEPLSERELEVLSLIASGMSNQDIAEKLVLTVGTVKSHNSNIYSKLGVKNRTQAINVARDSHLI